MCGMANATLEYGVSTVLENNRFTAMVFLVAPALRLRPGHFRHRRREHVQLALQLL